MQNSKSKFAPASYPDMPEVAGVQLAGISCGIKKSGKKDLLVAKFDEGTNVAGVFTKSTTAAACVEFCRANLGGGVARALVVNSGNANAFTGDEGKESNDKIAEFFADKLGVKNSEIFISSTGVIGEKLPTEKINAGADDALKNLSGDAFMDAASAIMTTDTYPKLVTRTLKNGIVINGIAKGSGMIAPNMATMLAYIFTDAKIDNVAMQQTLQRMNEKSFNSITVDSDTSTNDTVLFFATGKKPVDNEAEFEAAFKEVMMDLALQIVKDGEGISKLLRVNVKGAGSERQAKIIAKSVANSPLVKTAAAGEDANWGRIIMAIGKTQEPVDKEKIKIYFGDILIADGNGTHQSYSEEKGAAYMKRDEIDINIDLGAGDSAWTIYTCDLTHEYISINADYRS